MRIRTRLFLGFGALIFLMFALAGIGIDRLSSIKDNLQDVYANRYNKVILANGTRFDVSAMSKHMANLVANPGTININGEMQLLEKAQAGAEAKFIKLTELSKNDPEETKVVTAVNDVGAEFLRYKAKLLALIKEGKIQDAVTMRAVEGLPLQDRLAQKLEDLAVFHQERLEKTLLAINDKNHSALIMTIGVTTLGLLLGLAIIFWIIYSITGGLSAVSRMINAFADGTLEPVDRNTANYRDEISEVGVAFHSVARDLMEKTAHEQELNNLRDEQNWLNSNLAQMTTMLQGVNDLRTVMQTFVSEVTPMVGASFGAVYLKEDQEKDQTLNLFGSYAFRGGADVAETFRLGDGLVGQCALDRDKIRLSGLPADYIKIGSGLGETTALDLMIHPIEYEEELIGVLEIASVREFSVLQEKLVELLCHNLGILLNNLIGRSRMEELLRISQSLTEELQSQSEELLTQQEELRASNEKLEEQTKALQDSEEMLQRQQAELEQTNEELVKKTRELELQVWETEQTNRQIEKTKSALERQAVQLAMASKYKSEFLANMSHELRTPLNSMLILSQLLADNKEGNLTVKQVEFANTIRSSGFDLLKLIDEVLDLSKVEAGKVDIDPEYMALRDIGDYFQRNFQQIANKGGVDFHINLDEHIPETIYTDGHRLQQIVKNLLSNAFKFTKKGSVTLDIRSVDRPNEYADVFANTDKLIAISVIDTGIGIPKDKLELIFEAFQQADGTTSRKYGGTGLGLSISRELARLLGGVIDIQSTEGQGSTFTLYLPASIDGSLPQLVDEAAAARDIVEDVPDPAGELLVPDVQLSDPVLLAAADLEDDRDTIEEGDRVILIVEDDLNFANIMLDMARARGFKGLAAMQGDKGLALAQAYKPDAIILDIQLPVMDGWSVLNHLKHNSETRHIPVHVISVVEESRQGLTMGAISYLQKPISREHLEESFSGIERFLNDDIKQLLIVEDDEELRTSLVELIGHDDVAITAVTTGKEALAALQTQSFDCMVLDLGLSDVSGFDLLNTIRRDDRLREVPIIIYSGKELDKQQELELKKYAESIVIKNVKTPERVFDETALFLHRVESNLPEDKRKILENLYSREAVFSGKRILLVDDDIRNVFALSSVLENYNMSITFAENGKDALSILEQDKQFDLVLMDIMMPEMDGYDTMRAIRGIPEFAKLPIIALTAKAMKEDRNKCIEAGASDYITKPVNTDQLLSLLKVWLYQ